MNGRRARRCSFTRWSRRYADVQGIFDSVRFISSIDNFAERLGRLKKSGLPQFFNRSRLCAGLFAPNGNSSHYFFKLTLFAFGHCVCCRHHQEDKTHTITETSCQDELLSFIRALGLSNSESS